MAPVTKPPVPPGMAPQAPVCRNDRDITAKPLYHFSKASLGSHDSFQILQETIDHLDCKAKAGMPFTGNDREFLVNLYESLRWGGMAAGMFEAATLANHYVRGDGRPLQLDAALYRGCVIVRHTIEAMKAHLRDLHSTGQSIQSVSSTDPAFRQSEHAKLLQEQYRSLATQGAMLHDGILLMEQNNRRLHGANSRSHLAAATGPADHGFVTRWSVIGLYEFSPYPNTEYTEIPVQHAGRLKLPDGLSNHMHMLGIAQAFRYTAEWTEAWR